MKKLLMVFFVFFVAYSFTDVTKPNTYSPGDVIKASKLNQNDDTTYSRINNLYDSLEINFLRFRDFKDTTIDSIKTNKISSNPTIDSINGSKRISGNPIFDSIQIGSTGYYTGNWVDYYSSSIVTGWASFTKQELKYIRIGNAVTVEFCIYGTSNSNSTKFTLPIKASSINAYYPCYVDDSTITASSYATPKYGFAIFHTDSLTVNFYNTYSPTWQNHGSKNISGSFTYMAKK